MSALCIESISLGPETGETRAIKRTTEQDQRIEDCVKEYCKAIAGTLGRIVPVRGCRQPGDELK